MKTLVSANAVIERAKSDPAFLKRCKIDPKSACNEVGYAIPDGKSLQLIELEPNELHLFLGTTTSNPRVSEMLKKAHLDGALKARLLANPHDVIEVETGIQIPSETVIHVYDENPNEIRLLIPAGASEQTSSALSDQELELVSGGGFFKNILNAFCPNKTNRVTDNSLGTFVETTDYSLGGAVQSGSAAW